MEKKDLYTDNELFKRIAQDDHPAFTELVERYWNNLYGQAIAYLKDSHKAQDIVQEIFLTIWNKRGTLLDVGKPDNYFFILTRNKIISELRKKLTVPISDDTEQMPQESNLLPDNLLAHKQLHGLIQTAIKQMPPQRKKVFELSRQEGLKYEEIADRLGISQETVKGHMIKALAFIRTFIRHHIGFLLISLHYL